MGCELYRVLGLEGRDQAITFGEEDDARCLCCFNPLWPNGLVSSPSWQRALMMLGAAVVLVHRGQLTGGMAYLPGDLPVRLVEAIGRIIPRQDA